MQFATLQRSNVQNNAPIQFKSIQRHVGYSFKGFFLFWSAIKNYSNNAEQRLLKHLFTEYDRDGHPGGGISVKVWIGAKVVRIVNIVSGSHCLGVPTYLQINSCLNFLPSWQILIIFLWSYSRSSVKRPSREFKNGWSSSRKRLHGKIRVEWVGWSLTRALETHL